MQPTGGPAASQAAPILIAQASLNSTLDMSGLTGTLPALSAGSTPAMSLMGRQDLITMSGPNGFDIGWQYSGDRKLVIRRMYEGQNWLHMAGSETMKAFDLIDICSHRSPVPPRFIFETRGRPPAR